VARALHRASLAFALLAALSLLAAGCAVEADGPAGPPREGPSVVQAQPADGVSGVSPWVRPRLLFDTYLDPLPLQAQGALKLVSGQRTISARQRYDPVARAVELLPREPLRPHVVYKLQLQQPEDLRDTDGRPLQPVATPPPPPDAGPSEEGPPAPAWAFLVGADRAPPPPGPTPSQLRARAERVLLDRCVACHGPSNATAGLDLSRPAALASRAAITRPDRLILVPGHPGDSYLLHKTLPLYPDRGGDAMPPGPDALDADTLALLRDALWAAVWW